MRGVGCLASSARPEAGRCGPGARGRAHEAGLSWAKVRASLLAMTAQFEEAAPLMPEPRVLKGDVKRLPLALVATGAVVVVAGVALVPPDKVLGANVRMVFFHGAVTWTGIVMTVLAGIAGLGLLLLGRPGVSVVWRAQSLAALFWVASLIISFPVMIRTWGGVIWNEPKLLMSAEIVTALLVVWAIGLIVDDPRVIGGLALGATVILGILLAVTPGAFHPDNPIMRSGDPLFIGSFFLVAAGLVAMAVGALLAGRGRL